MLDLLRHEGIVGLHKSTHLNFTRAVLFDRHIQSGSIESAIVAKATVESALQWLTAKQRDVVVLRDIEGWSEKEISRRLGISLGAYRMRHWSALRKLRVLFNGPLR